MASTRVLVYVQRKGTENKPYLARFTQVIYHSSIESVQKCNYKNTIEIETKSSGHQVGKIHIYIYICGHIQLTIKIYSQQQYIKLNIHSEVSIFSITKMLYMFWLSVAMTITYML